MLPLVGIPKTVAKFLKQYRKVFCREAGFKHVTHYISQFPNADYAFDQGVLSRPLTEVIEGSGKHWVR